TGPTSAFAGNNITYGITFTNNGPSDAQSVQLTDVLPNNTTFVSLTQNSGPPNGGALPAGGTQTFTLVVHVNSNTPNGTMVTNSVTASSSTSDPNSGNNSSSVTT